MTAVDTGRAVEQAVFAAEPPTVEGIRASTAPVLARLAEVSASREQRREYSWAEVAELASHGIGLVGIARGDGGAGGTVRDVAELVIDIARADSSVAQALRTTFLTAYAVTAGAAPQRERTLERLRSGHLFAGTANERTGAGSGEVTATAVRVEGGFVVDGDKYYSTGGLYATWFSTAARTDDDRVIRFTVPFDRAGVERLDDFDAVGQRLTASGTTRLRGVHVPDEDVVFTDEPLPDNPYRGTWAQLYLAAIQAGIAARALDDAVRVVHERSRPIKHSTASSSTEDPYVRQTVGEIAARAQAARAVVLLAAEDLDAVTGLSGTTAHDAGARVAVVVAQAGVVAIESALSASELLFDVGGGSLTDRSLGLDRHWRNARTAANHNPRQWKQAVAGAYHLTGEEPPTTGLF